MRDPAQRRWVWLGCAAAALGCACDFNTAYTNCVASGRCSDDAGALDSGAPPDGGGRTDGGTGTDAGAGVDAGARADGGATLDGGEDGGVADSGQDAGTADSGQDAGQGSDAGSGATGILHVQNQTAVDTVNADFFRQTFTQNVSAGDLLVGVFRGQGMITVADSLNGSWTEAANTGDAYIFYLQGSDAGSVTVTVSSANMASNMRMALDEFSGVATSNALDLIGVSDNSSTSGEWTSGPSGVVGAGELVYAGATCSNGNVSFVAGSTQGAAMTFGGQSTNANGAIFSEYVLAADAGSQDSSALPAPAGAGLHGGEVAFFPAP